jgi:hypothetical protein
VAVCNEFDSDPALKPTGIFDRYVEKVPEAFLGPEN